MADIRLLNIILPTQTGAVQPTGTPQNSGGQATGFLSNVTPGTVLSGFIINRDVNGNPVLRTDQGDVTFASDVFLKIGSEVVIRVQQQAGQTLAKLLTINGQPPEAAQNQSSFADAPEVVVGGHLANTPAAKPATTANPQTAAEPVFVLAGKVVALPTPTQATPLPPGTELRFKLVNVSATPEAAQPAAPPAAQQPAANPAAAASYAAYAKTPPTSPIPTATPLPTAQTPATAIPTQTIPTPQATTQPQQLVPVTVGQQITGQVLIQPGSDQPLLQTPIGAIRLDGNSQLPQGSKVTLEVQQIITPQALQQAALSTAIPPTPITELATGWKTAQDIFSLLFSKPGVPPLANPGINILPTAFAEAIVPPFTPQNARTPVEALVANVNLFVSALKSSDMRAWLGRNTASWLEENHEGLFKKLESEFLQLARQYTGAQPGNWQALFYPLAAYSEVHMARIFVKREKPKKENDARKKPTEDTRFVVEVDMSQMGELQMDGFVRRGENVQFDMVIRSLHPLPENVQNDILAIYNSTGEATGYAGQLSFQAVREFPVNPMQEITNQHVTGLLA